MTTNPPIKHHFIAQFLLAAWGDDQGKLLRFTNPWADKVAAKYIAPAELGYKECLYSVPGEPPERAQRIEQHLSRASTASPPPRTRCCWRARLTRWARDTVVHGAAS
jgi:hypothetical protein